MPSLSAYLTFNGNCREAMSFYQECLGGELFFQELRDSPQAFQLPNEMHTLIVHATLTKDNFQLTATDLVSEHGLIKGNAVSILLRCSSEQELKTYFHQLAAGGDTELILSKTADGGLSGNLRDKFGINWYLHTTTT